MRSQTVCSRTQTLCSRKKCGGPQPQFSSFAIGHVPFAMPWRCPPPLKFESEMRNPFCALRAPNRSAPQGQKKIAAQGQAADLWRCSAAQAQAVTLGLPSRQIIFSLSFSGGEGRGEVGLRPAGTEDN